MTQSSMSVGNVEASAARTALNTALESLATLSTGATAPASTFANMLWYDATAGALKKRTPANDGWETLITALGLGTAATVDVIDEDDMATNSATRPPSQQSTKAYVDTGDIGVGQTWQDVSASRAVEISYQNTTGKPIQVAVRYEVNVTQDFEVSSDGVTWITLPGFSAYAKTNVWAIIPDDWYYIVRGSGTILVWAELR